VIFRPRRRSFGLPCLLRVIVQSHHQKENLTACWYLETGYLGHHQICRISPSCQHLIISGRPWIPLPHISWMVLCRVMHSLTLKSLVRTGVAILVRMRQEAYLAICFFYLSITGSLFNGKDFVEGRRATFSYTNNFGFLFGCKRPRLTAICMLPVFRVAVCLRIRARGFRGHAARWNLYCSNKVDRSCLYV